MMHSFASGFIERESMLKPIYTKNTQENKSSARKYYDENLSYQSRRNSTLQIHVKQVEYDHQSLLSSESGIGSMSCSMRSSTLTVNSWASSNAGSSIFSDTASLMSVLPPPMSHVKADNAPKIVLADVKAASFVAMKPLNFAKDFCSDDFEPKTSALLKAPSVVQVSVFVNVSREPSQDNYHTYRRNTRNHTMDPILEEIIQEKENRKREEPVVIVRSEESAIRPAEHYFNNHLITPSYLSESQHSEVRERAEKAKNDHMELKQEGGSLRPYVPPPTPAEREYAIDCIKAPYVKQLGKKKTLFRRIKSIFKEKPEDALERIEEGLRRGGFQSEIRHYVACKKWHENNAKRIEMEKAEVSSGKAVGEAKEKVPKSQNKKLKTKGKSIGSVKKWLCGGGPVSKGDMSRRFEFGPPIENDPLVALGELFMLDGADIQMTNPGEKMSRQGVFRYLYEIIGEFNTPRSSANYVTLLHPNFAEDLLNLEAMNKTQKLKGKPLLTAVDVLNHYKCFPGRGQINRAIVPVLRNGHFVLLHYGLDAEDRVHAHIMDSLLSGPKNTYLSDEEARTIGGVLFNVASENVYTARATEKQMPHQNNTYDCGPHTILSAEACLRDEMFNPDISRLSRTRNPDEESITNVRERISTVLRRLFNSEGNVPETTAASSSLQKSPDTVKTEKSSTMMSPTCDPRGQNDNKKKFYNLRSSQGQTSQKEISTDPQYLPCCIEATSKPKQENDGKTSCEMFEYPSEDLQDCGKIEINYAPSSALEDKRKAVGSRILKRKRETEERKKRQTAAATTSHTLRTKEATETTPQRSHKKVFTECQTIETRNTSAIDLNLFDTLPPEIKAKVMSSSTRTQSKLMHRMKSVIAQHTEQESSTSSASTASSSDSSYTPSTVTGPKKYLTMKQRENLVKQLKEHKRSLEWLCKRFSLYPDPRNCRYQIKTIQKEVSMKRPNRFIGRRMLQDRMAQILDVHDEILQEDIHEDTIQRFGVEQSIVFGLKNFKGSPKWVHTVKKKLNLVSRHIDSRTVRPVVGTKDKVEDDIKRFKSITVPMIMRKFSPDRIFNVDQTGMKYETTRNRTLTKKGRNKVNRTCQRKSATTHSFTVNPCISASGKLIEPTFVTLKEQNVPRSFKRMVAPFGKLRVTHTKSGIMTSQLAIDWMLNVFLKNVPDNSLLLCDSWPGFDQMRALPILRQRKIKIIVFPPKTTSKLQPLDLSFNRQYKHFIKKLTTEIRFRANHIIVGKRSNQLDIISMATNQFGAPRFTGLIQRGFHKIGISTSPPPYFETPAEFCFNVLATSGKLCSKCKAQPYFRCAYCETILCAACCIKHLH